MSKIFKIGNIKDTIKNKTLSRVTHGIEDFVDENLSGLPPGIRNIAKKSFAEGSIFQDLQDIDKTRYKNYDPQRSYMFNVIINGIDIQNMNEIAFFVKSVSIPQHSIDFITHDYLGHKFFWAGKDASAHTVTITFWDDENLTVMLFLQEWMQKMNDKSTGNQNTKQDYIGNMSVRTRDNSDNINTGLFHMKKVFPIEIADSMLSYEGSEIMEVSATFIFEDVDYNL